jgi:hypothetical protein
MPLLVYLVIMMPFRLCFANEAKKGTGLWVWEFMIDMVFIMDIVFNFRTGYFVLSAGERADMDIAGDGDGKTDTAMNGDELVEYDRWRVAKNYMKVGLDCLYYFQAFFCQPPSGHQAQLYVLDTLFVLCSLFQYPQQTNHIFVLRILFIQTWFLLDVISGIPFPLIEIIITAAGGGGDGEEGGSSFNAIKSLKILRFFKLGRLLKLEKILSNLDRETLDNLADFLQRGSTKSGMVIARLTLAMAYACHLMACVFVFIGKVGDKADVENDWLDFLDVDGHGPYSSIDTTGRGDSGDGAVYTIYISSFYFCLTTMTSVGYGDILPVNNLERLYGTQLQNNATVK